MTELRLRKVGKNVLVLTTNVMLLEPIKQDGRTIDLRFSRLAIEMMDFFNASHNIDASKVSIELNAIVIREYYYYDLDSITEVVEAFRCATENEAIFLGFDLSEHPRCELVLVSSRMGVEEVVSRGIIREISWQASRRD